MIGFLRWLFTPRQEHGLVSPRVREILDDPVRRHLLLDAYLERKRREYEAYRRLRSGA